MRSTRRRGRPPVWHHGDLDVCNWLVQNGRISGVVIDWGSGRWRPRVRRDGGMEAARARRATRSREALPTDDATWDRARGWALSQAVAALAYYTPQNNPIVYREAESWLDLMLSELD